MTIGLVERHENALLVRLCNAPTALSSFAWSAILISISGRRHAAGTLRIMNPNHKHHQHHCWKARLWPGDLRPGNCPNNARPSCTDSFGSGNADIAYDWLNGSPPKMVLSRPSSAAGARLCIIAMRCVRLITGHYIAKSALPSKSTLPGSWRERKRTTLKHENILTCANVLILNVSSAGMSSFRISLKLFETHLVHWQ